LSEVPAEIIELVDKFERNLEAYKNPNYKEEQLKQEFINPFFKALGWDVDNIAGAAPQYRDVIFEDSIKIAGGTRAPDYCFTLAGRKMFFVEAKKPSVNIDKDIKPSYQLRRYAWSAKLPLSILTDFEELAVYESKSRPKKNDRASTSRIKILTYKDYIEQWDYLYNTFSKDAVFKGAYDKYAETTKKGGTTQVDDEFLSEIETWRELLAKNIALRNLYLSEDDVNYSVQQIIDRIIFLRMAEDRGAEKYGQLQKLLDKQEIYQELCEIWKTADEKYNSGLFHFKNEKTQKSPPDNLTPGLKINDGIFKQIIKNLYYPDSPYEFSVISPEILGNVYEQFLGKVIRLTAGHQAKVEEKPEVKKAGGVYYTPQYIVESIVKTTIGKLCKDKTPQKVSELRILDPSCGSGSFLLGAYNYLLNWHLIYYSNLKDKNRLKDQIYNGKNNEWHLTIKEKKRILLNNIYGVDIDHQAVEVTKLSLLLKVLEGENKDVLEAQQKLFKERVLPDLGNNIKCGNSLIGPEIYSKAEFKLTAEDVKRINPFDWNDEYSEIMANGGFDAIIGNPPYIRIQQMKEFAPIEIEFYKDKYISAKKGNYDIYVVFIEKGLNLLNDEGQLGYIVSHKFFKRGYGKNLRSMIAEGKYLSHIVHFGDQQVFKKITTYTCLLFLNKKGSERFSYVKAHDLPEWKLKKEGLKGKVRANRVSGNSWSFLIGPPGKLLDRLDDDITCKLKDITSRIFQGFKTGCDDVYIFDEVGKESENVKIFSKQLESEYLIEPDLLHPLVKGGNSKPYNLTPSIKKIIFPYIIHDNSAILIPKSTLKEKYPLTWKYLSDNKKDLEKRDRGKMKGEKWYAYSRSQALTVMNNPKIFVPDVANCSSYSIDMIGDKFFTGGAAGGYGILVKDSYSKKYVLGLLNSKLLEWYIINTSTEMRGGYFSFESPFIKPLPIRTVDLDNPDDVAYHNNVITLVKLVLKLYTELYEAKTPNNKQRIQRQIDATDKQIDKLVYELYGLTEDEINIVEDGII
jgi:type I restriction-modification system DNA methylase subunit